MEKNFGDENFEEFLRESSDGLRMKPSAEVWERVSGRLSRKKRRAGFFLTFAMLATSALGYYLAENARPDAQPVETRSQKPAAATPFTVIHGVASSSRTDNDQPAARIPNTATATINPMLALIAANTQHPDRLAALDMEHDLPQAQTNATEDVFSSVVDDDMIDRKVSEKPDFTLRETPARDPLSIESIAKRLHPKLDKHIRVQYYFTPTFSYRKLGENKSFLLNGNAQPSYLSYSNVKSMVTHKPDLGFELGIAGRYRLTRTLTLRAGVQMNVSRYDMKTYSSSSELATIRLNSSDNSSIKSITHYNNFSGYKSNWIQNFYLQASAPVGVEVKLSGDDHMQFGIGTTIQPTYILSDRNYVLSTDYKNYAEVPGLTRRWNVNSSLEAFIAYNAGDLRWQIGPQLRYQLLSSFVTAYPVKENLMDLGLKIAISHK